MVHVSNWSFYHRAHLSLGNGPCFKNKGLKSFPWGTCNQEGSGLGTDTSHVLLFTTPPSALWLFSEDSVSSYLHASVSLYNTCKSHLISHWRERTCCSGRGRTGRFCLSYFIGDTCVQWIRLSQREPPWGCPKASHLERKTPQEWFRTGRTNK